MSRDRPKDYRKGSGVPDILSIPAEDMLANAKWRTISWRTGTKWHGLHRHALMTMIAYAFLQHRRLATARRKKNSTGRRLSQLCPPWPRHPRTLRSTTAAAMPALSKMDLQRAAA